MIALTPNISDRKGVLSAINVVSVLCFPGFLKGAFSFLDRAFKHEMKLAAAKASAVIVSDKFIQIDYITPTIFDSSLLKM